MPHDEQSEEKPRVYLTEGGDLDRPDKLDIVGDDKADLSRMADDEIAKTEASTSAAHTNKGARTTASNPIQLPPNGSLIGRHKTAFNAVSPSYISAMHPQAQMLHHFAAQQYYSGLWGNRIPFSSHHAPNLASPGLGSPSYGATFGGVGVYPSPHPWLTAFQFDAAAKAGFTYAPLVMGMGVPAQISPSFPSPMDQLHMNMAFNARMESPLFIPSPLHSPDTGAPIALGTKMPAQSVTALKLSMPNGGGCSSSLNAGLGSSPSYVHHPANHPNPLLSMRKILVPPVTTTVTGVAASSFATTLNGVCNESRSTSDKQMMNEGMKRTSTMNDVVNQQGNQNGHHHQHHPTTSSLLRHKEASSKKMHIKKPLNAFMLYMKEMRPTVMQEAGLKERQSAEINRILGRRWHSLTRDEQQKYYEMAKKERQEHLKKYPSWSARDNYAVHKKKKRKRDKAQDNLEAKKCRARFGLDQQAKWCKHCRRKKKCLWFKDGDGDSVDAADASPAAQVTSTSQFSSEDDFQHGVNSEKVQFKDGDVNSPHSLVTSTTTHRGSRPIVADGDDAEMDVTKNDEDSETESDDHEMIFTDEDDEIVPTSPLSVEAPVGAVETINPTDLVTKIDDINVKAEILKT